MTEELGKVTTILKHQGFDGVTHNPAPDDVIVAGVYVKEDRADFIVGCLNADNLSLFLGEEVPRTYNEDGKKRAHSFFPRQNLKPKDFIEAAARHLASIVDRIDYIVVACFGTFMSLKFTGSDVIDDREYGRLNNVRQYPDWQRLSLYVTFKEAFREHETQPTVRVCTDVDAAACGEYWADPLIENNRADTERSCVAFLKFSRTINLGICANGRPWQGQLHPVAGSIVPRRFSAQRGKTIMQDDFAGCCRFHTDCLEGLIGQEALEKRTRTDFHKIKRNDVLTWEIVAYYIASLCIG
jgi:fructokinase